MRRTLPFASALVLAFAVAGCGDDGSLTPTTGSTGNPPGPDASADPFGPLGERSDLPVDDRIELEGLKGPVDVVRDKYGRPHIYATTTEDALMVEGYFTAKDRTFQLELLRRVAEGRLGEILAQLDSSLIDVDISFRHIGLHRVAKKEYAALPAGSELKSYLDSYSSGITQAYKQLRAGKLKLPVPLQGAIEVSAFTDWNGEDSLAMARLQTYLLSYDGDSDVSLQAVFDGARSSFQVGDPDPMLAKRAGIERDLIRWAGADPATTTTGYPMVTKSKHVSKPPTKGPNQHRKKSPMALATRGYIEAMNKLHGMLNPDGFGSNNWAVQSTRSANGHAMVASDPHLTLQAPAVFWPVSIDVADKDATKNLKIAGLSFPGIPAIILGHNENVGWGATVAGYDVSDAYTEKLSADLKTVEFNGKQVALETVDEEIKIQGGTSLKYKVYIVPHHGPIIPDIQQDHTIKDPDPANAVSVKWTGLQPTTELAGVVGLLRSKNVDEARESLKQFQVGAQNWMLGDTNGDVLWTSHAQVPIRDPKAFTWDAQTYTGTLPCLILPGDGSAEWKGFLDDDLVPWAKNPKAGFISTANNDPIGVTLDNDPSNDTLPDGTPMYLHCTFDIGFREGRIQKRITDHTAPFKQEDLSAIQGDHHSSMGARLTSYLILAIDAAEAERTTPGAHPDLAKVVADPSYDKTWIGKVRTLLDGWKALDYEAASGIDPTTNKPLDAAANKDEVAASQAASIFNTWLVRARSRIIGDELQTIGAGVDSETASKALLHLFEADPATLATYDATTKDSAIWDDLATPEVESRLDRIVRALLDAKSVLDMQFGMDPATYRWGALHTIRFESLISVIGDLSIPPAGDTTFPSGFPRPGDLYNVDACDFPYVSLMSAPKFSYGHGPTQRFVVEMDPAGPKAVNALPGGEIWDNKSSHFADEVELWRRNQVHPIPFLLDDVVKAKEARTVAFTPAK